MIKSLQNIRLVLNKNLNLPNKLITSKSSLSQKASQDDYYIIDKNEMEDFMTNCMTTAGSKQAHAKSLASCLILADYRGHFSHGLNRLDMYVRDVMAGTVGKDVEPSILRESPATAHVDGNNLLGPVVGNFCMDLAIKKAKEVGIGMVVAKRSNHYGIAGYYSMQAVEQDLIGMSFTNTSPLCFPTRSNTRSLGTNPITVAAPGKDNDNFVLDMATTTVAFGKVELSDRKGESIPKTWGADESGHATKNPQDVLHKGALLPLGGEEESGGYKGYGLMLMVEILCGILGDGQYGRNIRTWQDSSSEANLGQCFIAINHKNFGDGFNDRLQDLMDDCRNLTPIEKDKKILVAGDPERISMKKCNLDKGISYHVNQVEFAKNLASKLNISAPRSKLITK